MLTLKDRYRTLLKSTGREGIDRLIDYLDNTDFYEAPASTKYHLSKEGGLLEHTLNVYDCLERIAATRIDKNSIIISALLHDLCKVNFYVKVTKSRKMGMKVNDYGKVVADWQDYETYEVEDTFPIGHGEKSVIIAQKYISLTDLEIAMIRWHMGPGRDDSEWTGFYKACTKYPEVALIHNADMEATYVIEANA